MNPNTKKLHDLGQRIWLDNISRHLLTSGTLAHYISDLSVTGLTSNPTIFEQAIAAGTAYDGIKVIAGSGWFAARPSGTEDIYKIYAESFSGSEHLKRILVEAQTIVNAAISPESS